MIKRFVLEIEGQEKFDEMAMRRAMQADALTSIIWNARFNREYSDLPANEAIAALCLENGVNIEELWA
jgi:hypothetical protein